MRNKILQEALNEIPKETKIFVRLYTDIVSRINQLLELKNMSQMVFSNKSMDNTFTSSIEETQILLIAINS